MATYITTTDTSDSTVTVSSVHRSERGAKATGRRVLEVWEHRGSNARRPRIADRLDIYHEHTADYVLAPRS
jgi:hypothetical protein